MTGKNQAPSSSLVGPWCVRCGQRARDLARPFFMLIGDFFENALAFDGRSARTHARSAAVPAR